MYTGLEKFIVKIKSSSIFILISVSLVLLASAVGLISNLEYLKSVYDRSIGEKSHSQSIINKLQAGTNIKYFESLLGTPAFINSYPNRFEDSPKNIEYIFIKNGFYVQAITNLFGKVFAYSITSSGSHPIIEIITPTIDRVVLGKSLFSDIASLGKPDKIINYLGAHDWFYGEMFYFGNPGAYQTYVFSNNRSGIYDFYVEEDPQSNRVINTVTIFAPLINSTDIGLVSEDDYNNYPFGPDYNQIRTLR